MNEIADNLQISKSAVQDLIKRTLVQLNAYEETLKMIDTGRKLNDILDEMKRQDDQQILAFADRIEKIMK